MDACKNKLTIFVFITLMIILSVFSGMGEARTYLGYGPLTKDITPSCSSKNPKSCVKTPVHSYHEGCEISTRCKRKPNPSSSS